MTETTFRTERLPLAALIHSKNLLNFRGCEAASDNKGAWIFDDPESAGESIELQFDSGRNSRVDARQFVSSERFLKRRLFQVLKGAR